jgi:WD40 repeat protein
MRYRAFFSYSRADDRVANWLHRQLDSYRTPKSLTGTDGMFGPVPEKLFPIFRDRTDMSGGGQLSERIERALTNSEALVVLCSRASASSEWVNAEVETFIRLGRQIRIFPVIAAGAGKSDDPEGDFFPPALRGHGLLAADLREIKHSTGRITGDGRDGGRLKLIAGLLGAQLDSLVRREQMRRRLAHAATLALAILFLVLAIAASSQWLVAQRNQERAYSVLGRVVAERAWQAVAERDLPLALRFALLGIKTSRDDTHQFDVVLRRVISDTWPKPASQIGGFSQARLNFDGSRIAAWGPGAELKILNADFDVVANTQSNGGDVTDVSFSPQGSVVAIAATDRSVRLLDYNSGEASIIATDPDFAAHRIAFSRSGRFVSVTWFPSFERPEGAPATIMDLRTGGTMRLPHGQDWVKVVAFSADDKVVATGVAPADPQNNNHSVRIWNRDTGLVLESLAGHTGNIEDISFSSDGELLASASSDGTIRVWRWAQRQPLWSFSSEASDPFVVVQFSTECQCVSGATSTGSIYTFSLSTGVPLAHLRGPSGWWQISGNGRTLVSLDSGYLRTHDQLLGAYRGVAAGDFRSPDWFFPPVVSSAGDWQLLYGNYLQPPYGIPNADFIAFMSTPVLVNLVTGDEIKLIGHYGSVEAGVFDAQGTRVFTVGGQTLRTWDVATGQSLSIQDVGSMDSVLALSRDATIVFVGSSTGVVQAWDVRTRNQIAEYRAEASQDSPNIDFMLSALKVSDDQTRLIAVLTNAGQEIRQDVTWDISMLTASHHDLVSTACSSFALGSSKVSFSADQLLEDPVASEMLAARGFSRDVDLCGDED